MPETKKTSEEDGNAVFDRFAEDTNQVEHDMNADRDERTDWGTSFAEPEPQGSGRDTAAMAENLIEPRSEGLVTERDPREVARHEGEGERQPVQDGNPEMASQVREEPVHETTITEPEPVKTVTISAAEYAALVAATRAAESQSRDMNALVQPLSEATRTSELRSDAETHAAEMSRRAVDDIDHDGIRDVAEDRDGDHVPDEHDVNMGIFGDEDKDHDSIRDVAEDLDGDRVPDDHDSDIGGREDELPMADPSTFHLVDGYNSEPLGTAEVTPHVMDRLEVIEMEKRAEADFENQNPAVRATPDRDLPARS